MSNKLLVAGGRDFTDYLLLSDVLDRYQLHYPIDSIIQGEARGADLLAKRYAKANDIKYIGVPADWTRFGRSAGHIRNTEMWNMADSGIIFWNGESSGTGHSLTLSVSLNKTLFVCNYVTHDFYVHYTGTHHG